MEDYQRSYNDGMPADIQDAVAQRNAGWDAFKVGDREEALVDLRESAEHLQSELPDLHEAMYHDKDNRKAYNREGFASAGLYSVALCRIGEWDEALIWAERAQVFPFGRPDHAPERVVDQYRIILDARLALVLTAGTKRQRKEAIDLGKQATKNAPFSEDLSHVYFPDTEMTPDQRHETYKKFSKAAKVARWATTPGIPISTKKLIIPSIIR